MERPRPYIFWSLLVGLTTLDCTTKNLAVDRLSPANTPHPIVGQLVRFTLAYNQKAAMGLSLGAYSRVGFIVIAAAMLVGLSVYYWKLRREGGVIAAALAMIGAGAAGNMIDRLRSSRGVVDFIDIGFGNTRFWTFNIADAAVFCGAVSLFLILSRRESDSAEPSR